MRIGMIIGDEVSGDFWKEDSLEFLMLRYCDAKKALSEIEAQNQKIPEMCLCLPISFRYPFLSPWFSNLLC